MFEITDHRYTPRAVIASLVLTVAALLFAASATAQQGQDFSRVQIQTTELGHQTYRLQGAGGNMTLAVGTDGAILVDSEFAPLHDKIKAAIGKITSVPVRYVIDTHFHTDHAGGNAPFAQEGAVIVAQVNARQRLAEGATNGLTGAKSAPAPTQALPTKTYNERL